LTIDMVARAGRFEIRRLLGRGGFGIVFQAFDPQLGRDVALKILRPEFSVDPHTRERFIGEARAAAHLDHPGIASVFDAGNVGPISYIAGAYCKGPTLAAWLADQMEPVPINVAVEIMARLAEAVEHAHSRGVLHRDLKPSNVLLEPLESAAESELPFTPKLVDFGLAKRLDAQVDHTRSGAVMGTMRYMAPEQLAGRPKDVRTSSDVYALGTVFYELLCGSPPFIGESDQEIQAMITSADAVAPRKRRPEIPRDLETVCLKCLAKDPHDRYATAAELGADLRRYLNHEPVLARPINPVLRFWRWCQRRPVVACLAATLAIIAFGSSVAVTWSWRRAEHHLADAISQRQAANENLRESQDTLVALQWALDERSFAFDDRDPHLDQLRSSLTDRFRRVLDRPTTGAGGPQPIRAVAHCFIAQSAAMEDDRPTALRHFSASLAQWRAIGRASPESAEYRQATCLALYAATACLARSPRGELQIEMDDGEFVRAYSLHDALDRCLLKEYGELLCRRSESYLRLNRASEGARIGRAALRLFERLGEQPMAGDDFRFWRAHASRIVGDNLTRLRLDSQANEYYQTAIAQLEAMAQTAQTDLVIHNENWRSQRSVWAT
jgi:serine/threonine protein kinase